MSRREPLNGRSNRAGAARSLHACQSQRLRCTPFMLNVRRVMIPHQDNPAAATARICCNSAGRFLSGAYVRNFSELCSHVEDEDNVERTPNMTPSDSPPSAMLPSVGHGINQALSANYQREQRRRLPDSRQRRYESASRVCGKRRRSSRRFQLFDDATRRDTTSYQLPTTTAVGPIKSYRRGSRRAVARGGSRSNDNDQRAW